MKTHSIIFRFCVAFLVLFVSVFFVDQASARKRNFKKTEGKVIKKVKSPDIVHLAPSSDDGSGWMLLSASSSGGNYLFGKGAKISLVVYLFRDFEKFTCRAYRIKNGKASGDPISLPKKALGGGYHKFPIKSTAPRYTVQCQESDSLPLTLAEFSPEQKASNDEDSAAEASATEDSTNEASAGEASAGEASAGEASAGEASVEQVSAFIGEPESAAATEADIERGWKILKARSFGADAPDTSALSAGVSSSLQSANTTSNTAAQSLHGASAGVGLLGLILAASTKSNIRADIYFHESVEALSCQLYYYGNKKKKRGSKMGTLKSLPDKKMKKEATGLTKGLLSIEVKGPAKNKLPPMKLACAEDKKTLPKKLTIDESGASSDLQVIDVFRGG